MRIGELAALAGVTTRTVRHYHRIGLLPESGRRANGYRVYGLADAVRLTRIRRLTELGLSLDEVRDALDDDAGNDLREVLAELDADLARQEERIRRRRARIAELLASAEAAGGLPPEGPVSPELAAFFADMALASAGLPGPEPAMAAKERELMALLDATGAGGSGNWLAALLGSVGDDAQGALRRAYDVYARMDALAGADPADPRVAEVAGAIVELMPEDIGRSLAEEAGDALIGAETGGGFAAAFFADLAPAQAEVVRQAMRLLWERHR
ncbi:MerR family transcriptional regulator [Streptomyces sp. PT12]|uniref:MerR family transcriptional regulator n=1 Tax=Streptomyces sp. PT12 TaxID=1510197 RepID=UPI000DE35A85|nr:MerR family transcriptional regulator [Streptomyces sp. PT12]RBM22431.1 MerR family transcriptional regulator [Streptomyces sp. PT12]